MGGGGGRSFPHRPVADGLESFGHCISGSSFSFLGCYSGMLIVILGCREGVTSAGMRCVCPSFLQK